MSQYTQRYRQLALIAWITLLVACSSNEPVATVVSVESITSELSEATEGSEGATVATDASAPAASTSESDPFADIYSSFASEMEEEVPAESEEGAPKQAELPPIEYLYEIKGGRDALADGVPSWLTGDRFMNFVTPVAFSFYEGDIYILDAGRHVLFRYDHETASLYSKMNLKNYLLGEPSSLTFDSKGYYFVTEPQSSRVLKFNPSDKLVGVYKDKANLSRPDRLYYHEPTDRLYIGDGVYSRVLVASRYGKFRFAVGSRGEERGEFVKITDFSVSDTGIYVADRLGSEPVQLLDSEGGYVSSISHDDVSIPNAIALDDAGRLYVADQEDDTIRIFIDHKLSWSVGGSGRLPGQFREISQMKINDGKLYVLDSLNRRIQVFRINDM